MIAATVFSGTEHLQAVALLRGRALCAPYLVDCELANVGLKKPKEGHPSETEVVGSLDDFSAMAIERHAIDLSSVLRLVRRYRLTACDAAYLWLAEQLQAPLATFDAKLAQAARRHLAGRDDDT